MLKSSRSVQRQFLYETVFALTFSHQHLYFLFFVLLCSFSCGCEKYVIGSTCLMEQKSWIYLSVLHLSWKTPFAALSDFLISIRRWCFFHQFFNSISFVMWGYNLPQRYEAKEVCRNQKSVAFCSDCTWMWREGCSVVLVQDPPPVPQSALKWALQQGKQQDALLWHQVSTESRADDAKKQWPRNCFIWGPVPRRLLI